VLLEPLRRRAPQRPDDPGLRSAQLEAQQVGEQVVVAEPGPSGVDGRDERVGALEALQDPLGARCAGEDVGERAADPIEHRRAQQQLADLRRLTVEHLGHEVVGDGALAARELGDEPLRLGVIGQRHRRQPQARGPALGAFAQRPDGRVAERHPVGLQQRAGLLDGEPEVAVANLRQRSGHPQPMEAERRLGPRRQHHPQSGRQPVDEQLEAPQSVGRAQLVQVVDHQHHGLRERLELVDQPLHPRLDVETGRGRRAPHRRVLAGRPRELVDDRQPEAPPILLAALDRHPCRAVAEALLLDPGTQEHRLAAAGRRADEHHRAVRRRRQPVEEPPPRDRDVPEARPVRCLRCARIDVRGGDRNAAALVETDHQATSSSP
jgi:hypothetical protein